MDPSDPAWPTGPALHLYDVMNDTFRPCTQRDLDRLMRLAAAAARARKTLTDPDLDDGDG
jgi:hypothetical protein